MVERTVYGASVPRVSGRCSVCNAATANMIVRYRKDDVIGEFCNFECELRHDGFVVEDGLIDKLLAAALKGGGVDGASTKTVD